MGSRADIAIAGRPSYVGTRIPRLEDDRLLTGAGRYVADVHLDGMLEVAFVRSQMAHARIRDVGLDGVRDQPGVVHAVVGRDLIAAGVTSFPDFIGHARRVQAPPLFTDRVRYVGAPIAAVVAEDRYRAEDAAELADVSYDELPAVASIGDALAPDAPRLFEDWPDNLMVDLRRSNPDVESLLKGSRVVRGTYTTHRHTGVPIETRGVVAEYRDGRLTVWTSTQNPHIERTTLSYLLGMPERAIRVVAPDVGGGFGSKTHVYGEDVVVAWLAMRLRRPVRWIEDRLEHMVASCHAREQVHEMEAAVADDGTITALRCRITCDVGTGEIFPPGINTSFVSSSVFTGPYRIPYGEVSVSCVVTNKTPSGAYRGFGIPEICFALERLVERSAAEVGADPVEVRRRMLLRPGDLPYELPSGARIDSGSHLEAFDRIVELGAVSAERERARLAGDPRTRVGVGYATYVEGVAPTYFGTTGHWTSHDSCTLRIDPDGGVVVAVGVSTAGQGLQTMVATLAADAVGVPLDQVTVVMGDTDVCPYGLGGWGSRSTVIGGGAVLKAAAAVREKVVRIAAHLLEAAPEDLVIEDGVVHVVGSDRPSLTLADVGRVAYLRTLDLPPGVDPGIEATATYDPPGLEHRPDERGRMNGAATYTNATHAAVASVDVTTGQIQLLEYLVAHDCGTLLNPAVVDGQVHGGVAQGIGGTLLEHLAYSPEGQPLAGTFMDYLLPSAAEIPDIRIEHFESPAPDMPLGVKGAGEAGTIGPPAAIANAVCDALREYGVDIASTPVTPSAIRTAIRLAGHSGGRPAGSATAEPTEAE
jgi:carbon-monoxide dehydrogenase large subunit